jgi:5'-nucleotidase (lipoprotein e(P4) family)
MNNGRGWGLGGAGLALGILIGYLAGAGPTPNPAERELLSDLYMQTSAEYHALCEQTYRHAWQSLQQRVKEQPKTGLPLAVVMDLDETVLDNSRYQSRLYQTGTTYSRETWAEWEKPGNTEVGLVPGALGFIKNVENMGDPKVSVVYISNRRDREGALDVLKRLGLATAGIDKRLYVRTNGRDKESRREEVRRDHRIVMLIGDNLADLSSDFWPRGYDIEKNRSNLEAQNDAVKHRLAEVERHRKRFGHDWIILPNPVYGDWLDVLGGEPAKHLRPAKAKP